MDSGTPSTAVAVLSGRCPRCGYGPLFAGYLRIEPRCARWGLDYALVDVGDGASEFVVLIVGFLVVGGAQMLEIAYAPPYWVHAIFWTPAVAILTLGGLRLVKSTLMVLQYKNQAREGRVAE